MKKYNISNVEAAVHKIPYNPLNDEDTKNFFGDNLIPKINTNTIYYEDARYVAEFWNKAAARWEGLMPGHYVVKIDDYYIRVTRETLRHYLGVDEVDEI